MRRVLYKDAVLHRTAVRRVQYYMNMVLSYNNRMPDLEHFQV